MKQLLTVQSILFLLLTSITFAQNGNMVLNGGFEDDLNHWDQSASNFVVSNENVHSGNYALKYDTVNFQNSMIYNSGYSLDVQAGVPYLFSFWFWEEDMRDAGDPERTIMDLNIFINGHQCNCQYYLRGPAISEWHKHEQILVFEESGPIEIRLAVIGYTVSDSAALYLDDIELVEICNADQCHTFTTSSTDQWQNTGVQFNQGDSIEVLTTGEINVGPVGPVYTPNGCKRDSLPDCITSPIDPAHFCTTAPQAYSMIAKLGESGECFHIGSRYSFTAEESGTLYLAFNDNASMYHDNTGEFKSCIEIWEAADTLYTPNEYVVTNTEIIVPVKYNNTTPTRGFDFPGTWKDNNLTLNYIVMDSPDLPNWIIVIDSVNNDSAKFHFAASQGAGSAPLLEGDHTLGYLHFDRPEIDCGITDTLCPGHMPDPCDSFDIVLDTTYFNGQAPLFVDTLLNGFVPNVMFDTVRAPYGALYDSYILGDMNYDAAKNIIDITYLISFLYLDGPNPMPYKAGDVNGDCGINILDVTHLIAYIYTGGQDLACGCAVIGTVTHKSNSHLRNLFIDYIDGKTMITIDKELAGLEVVLSADEPVEIKSSIDGIDAYYHQSGNHIKLGMVDITGENQIKSNQNIMVIDGIVKIESALGADLDNNAVGFNVVYSNAPTSGLPTEFSLGHNYPNPFNPTTTIEFSLPMATNVTLSVYDILGRRVETLVNEHLEAGSHRAIFDASSVASGVYFYRIETGDFTISRKMTLLK